MAESPRRLDLRLTISADAPYRAVATELVEKFAEYVGATAAQAKSLAQTVASALAPVAGAQPDRPIDLEVSAKDRELVVTANAGRTRATCPLPD